MTSPLSMFPKMGPPVVTVTVKWWRPLKRRRALRSAALLQRMIEAEWENGGRARAEKLMTDLLLYGDATLERIDPEIAYD